MGYGVYDSLQASCSWREEGVYEKQGTPNINYPSRRTRRRGEGEAFGPEAHAWVYYPVMPQLQRGIGDFIM